MRNAPAFLKLLLFSLMEDKPSYGYELIKKIEDTTNDYWQPGQGTIYGALERFEEEGLIEEVDADEDNSESNRQYYGLTEAGRKELGGLKDKCEEEISPEERILGLMYIFKFLAGENKFKFLLDQIKEEFSF